MFNLRCALQGLMFDIITWSWSNTTTLAPVDKVLRPDTFGTASLTPVDDILRPDTLGTASIESFRCPSTGTYDATVPPALDDGAALSRQLWPSW